MSSRGEPRRQPLCWEPLAPLCQVGPLPKHRELCSRGESVCGSGHSPADCAKIASHERERAKSTDKQLPSCCRASDHALPHICQQSPALLHMVSVQRGEVEGQCPNPGMASSACSSSAVESQASQLRVSQRRCAPHTHTQPPQ